MGEYKPEIKVTDGANKFKVCNGTYYHTQTADEVIWALEQARVNKWTVVLRLGYPCEEERPAETTMAVGEDWLEENDVEGTIGRSTGSCKIPLLIEGNSNGGQHVLDHCLVRIIRVKRRRFESLLYQHPKYFLPAMEIKEEEYVSGQTHHKYTHVVYVKGKLHARFTGLKSAERFVQLASR